MTYPEMIEMANAMHEFAIKLLRISNQAEAFASVGAHNKREIEVSLDVLSTAERLAYETLKDHVL